MVEAVRRFCRFLETRELRVTWFVVPKPKSEPLLDEWKGVLQEARDAGHDLQLHGLTHEDCFEFGPPAWPATTIRPQYLDEFAQHRDELMQRYTVEHLQARIEEGIAIFERELGVHPTVFRAPCGAISKPMFEALRRAGIAYHTCQYISGSGYEHLPHNSGLIRQQWTEAIPHRPYRWYAGIIEVPILNEYTWRGVGARSGEFIALAQQDVERIVQASPVAVILMHTHGIADDYNHAFRLVDAVVEHVARLSGHGFATFGELVRAGRLDSAATVAGPDTLAL
ncbi:MAG: polysaccharide deacetylase family protein [Chloroflexi bacterium]|nr:polysaccharide deacetylase family protein [Chloroflexota bacterium]